jgi:phosphomannomutase/phosphoglucomutase
MADFPKVYQAHELRPHCPDNAKGKVIAAATAHFQTKYPVNTLDGARIDFGDGAWAGIRQSNTNPCLSVCIEARSPEKLAAVEAEVLAHLKEYKEVEL